MLGVSSYLVILAGELERGLLERHVARRLNMNHQVWYL